jgi:hypothetical protein
VELLALAAIYDETPTFSANPWPFIALMAAGFVIGVFGHIARSRSAVALGIGLIFLGTFVLPLLLTLSEG